MESILISIKKLLGVAEDDDGFDQELLMHINSTFMILNQLAVGPSNGFLITDSTNTWNQILGARTDLDIIKSYIYLRVRLLFDPPQNSFLVESINRQITEFEWRMNVQAESGVTVNEEP